MHKNTLWAFHVNMSVFCCVDLQLKRRVHFHKILMWKIKNCLLFAPAANPNKERAVRGETVLLLNT